MRNRFLTLGILLVAGAVLASPARKAKKKVHSEQPDPAHTEAVLETDMGDITIKFFPDKAPLHVKNFIELAERGVYNGILFHRVIPGFMIQTGDPMTKNPKTPKEMMGTGGYVVPAGTPHEKGFIYNTVRVPNAEGKIITETLRNVPAEFNDISHKRGIVSMARANDPNSASSQFFIVVKDSTFLDQKYSAFGQVISGMDVADKIVAAPRDARDNPLSPIHIRKVVIKRLPASEAGTTSP